MKTDDFPTDPAAYQCDAAPLLNSGTAAGFQQQAESLTREGRAGEAEQLYRFGLERWPNSLELHLHFVRFTFQQGRAVEALKLLHDLLKTFAGHPEVWCLGAEICLSHPQFNEVGLDWTAEAVRLHPSNAQISAQRAQALRRGAELTTVATQPHAASAKAEGPTASRNKGADKSAAAKSEKPGKISFVLGSTSHGPMIFSRLDACYVKTGQQTAGFGVGHQLMEAGCYDPGEVDLLKQLLLLRREFFQDGVLAVDCGANIGVHSVEWGRLMRGWGEVISFEAQEKIYYALAGNIILNNLMNVRAIYAAVSDKEGFMSIPQPDYMVNSSFGSFELRKSPANENIGQRINYDTGLTTVRTLTLDGLMLPRLDLIKMDVEGMEDLALQGARETFARCKPIACIEVIKSDPKGIAAFFSSLGYRTIPVGLNYLAIHSSDPSLQRIGKGG